MGLCWCPYSMPPMHHLDSMHPYMYRQHTNTVDGSPHPHFDASLSFTTSRPCISHQSHPSFNGSLLVSIFNTINALFRFELMDHHTHNLNMSMYGVNHSLDVLLVYIRIYYRQFEHVHVWCISQFRWVASVHTHILHI